MFLGMPDTDLDFASTNQVSLCVCVCEFEIVLLKKKKNLILLNVSQLNLMSVEYVNKQRRVQNNLSSRCEIAIIKNKLTTFQHYPVGKTV